MKPIRLLVPALALALVVAAVALVGGDQLPRLSPAPNRPSTVTTSSGQELVDQGLATSSSTGVISIDITAVSTLLETIPVSDASGAIDYDRDAFGQAWSDTDHNGCDTRNDVLARDLTGETFKPGTRDCVVLTGTLADPFTGTTIQFVRGQGTSEQVQIDHTIPLSLAWRHGASSWTTEQREIFANDLANLSAVDGNSNASKSDKGPSEWLPTLDYQCEYVTRFAYLTSKYSLTIARSDASTIAGILPTCT